MASTPLFVTDVATLKSKLRLSGVPAASDADDIIDEAVLTVRAGFYRELGKTTVDQVLALPFVANPTTDNEVKRATANLIEVKWVRAELMRALPLMFMDGNADQTQIYHDEAAFREASQRQLDDERGRLMNDVENGLELLRGSSDPGHTQKNLFVTDISPDTTPQRPGDTIRPYGSTLWRGGNV